MALLKGKSNKGIKNLKPFPKGMSGYHFKAQKRICLCCEKEYITRVEHSKYCSPKCCNKMRPDRRPKGRKKLLIRQCIFCKDDFSPYFSKQKFCTRQCSGLFSIATGEYNYVTKAFVFHESKCNRCGIEDDRVLCVHHVDHNRKNNDILNLEIVCANCHHKHHYERGKTRRLKINAIKEFIKNNPDWREKYAT